MQFLYSIWKMLHLTEYFYSANEKAGEMRPTVALINMQGKSPEEEETT